MEDRTLIILVIILSLTTLEVAALICGLDGAYFMPIVAAISGIVGLVAGVGYQTKNSNGR